LTHDLESASPNKEDTESVEEDIEESNVAIKKRATHEKADGNQDDAGNDILHDKPPVDAMSTNSQVAGRWCPPEGPASQLLICV
jgi:hypothetical protein